MNQFVEYHSNKNPRLALFYYVFLALFLILILGLGWRQMIRHDDYETLEERRCLCRIIQPGPRGEIYDRDDRLLVANRPTFNTVIYLTELRHEFEKEYISRVRRLRDAGINVDRNQLPQKARMTVIERHTAPVEKILGKKCSQSQRFRSLFHSKTFTLLTYCQRPYCLRICHPD